MILIKTVQWIITKIPPSGEALEGNDHHSTIRGPVLNLKKGEEKGSEQNHMLSEKSSKQKSTRLSNEKVKNML